jgi:hypothetical protein
MKCNVLEESIGKILQIICVILRRKQDNYNFNADIGVYVIKNRDIEKKQTAT